MDEYNELMRRKMEALAETFPSMRGVSAVKPWDADLLDHWARTASHGERATALFLLTVWNRYDPWESGKWDAVDALLIWDDLHRKAFVKWAAAPWFA